MGLDRPQRRLSRTAKHRSGRARCRALFGLLLVRLRLKPIQRLVGAPPSPIGDKIDSKIVAAARPRLAAKLAIDTTGIDSR